MMTVASVYPQHSSVVDGRLVIGGCDAVELIGAKPLLLIHAEGDEQIPHQWSRELYERAAEPRKLIQLPGGHHRSAQHDADLQGLALRWIDRALGSV